MAADTGPPTGAIPYMTPFPVANDPLPPQPIPDVLHPENTLAERALARFSLSGQHAIGKRSLFSPNLRGKGVEIDREPLSYRRSPGAWSRLCQSAD